MNGRHFAHSWVTKMLRITCDIPTYVSLLYTILEHITS